jgi:hypothetical protein
VTWRKSSLRMHSPGPVALGGRFVALELPEREPIGWLYT